MGPRLVKVFLARFPDVKLHYLDGYSGHVNEWIVAGRVDMAVVNNGRRSHATRMDPLLTTDLFFVAHRDIVDTTQFGYRNNPVRQGGFYPDGPSGETPWTTPCARYRCTETRCRIEGNR